MAPTTPDSFISRWSAASASERSNSQPFLCELADLLNVERPHNNFDHGYAFEFTVTEHHHDGSTSERRIDLYKRACFVLESTSTFARRHLHDHAARSRQNRHQKQNR